MSCTFSNPTSPELWKIDNTGEGFQDFPGQMAQKQWPEPPVYHTAEAQALPNPRPPGRLSLGTPGSASGNLLYLLHQEKVIIK